MGDLSSADDHHPATLSCDSQMTSIELQSKPRFPTRSLIEAQQVLKSMISYVFKSE